MGSSLPCPILQLSCGFNDGRRLLVSSFFSQHPSLGVFIHIVHASPPISISVGLSVFKCGGLKCPFLPPPPLVIWAIFVWVIRIGILGFEVSPLICGCWVIELEFEVSPPVYRCLVIYLGFKVSPLICGCFVIYLGFEVSPPICGC